MKYPEPKLGKMAQVSESVTPGPGLSRSRSSTDRVSPGICHLYGVPPVHVLDYTECGQIKQIIMLLFIEVLYDGCLK